MYLLHSGDLYLHLAWLLTSTYFNSSGFHVGEVLERTVELQEA